jgi:hypothetical protein
MSVAHGLRELHIEFNIPRLGSPGYFLDEFSARGIDQSSAFLPISLRLIWSSTIYIDVFPRSCVIIHI